MSGALGGKVHLLWEGEYSCSGRGNIHVAALGGRVHLLWEGKYTCSCSGRESTALLRGKADLLWEGEYSCSGRESTAALGGRVHNCTIFIVELSQVVLSVADLSIVCHSLVVLFCPVVHCLIFYSWCVERCEGLIHVCLPSLSFQPSLMYTVHHWRHGCFVPDDVIDFVSKDMFGQQGIMKDAKLCNWPHTP